MRACYIYSSCTVINKKHVLATDSNTIITIYNYNTYNSIIILYDIMQGQYNILQMNMIYIIIYITIMFGIASPEILQPVKYPALFWYGCVLRMCPQPDLGSAQAVSYIYIYAAFESAPFTEQLAGEADQYSTYMFDKVPLVCYREYNVSTITWCGWLASDLNKAANARAEKSYFKQLKCFNNQLKCVLLFLSSKILCKK